MLATLESMSAKWENRPVMLVNMLATSDCKWGSSANRLAKLENMPVKLVNKLATSDCMLDLSENMPERSVNRLEK